MKKFLVILVLGLLWSNVGFAQDLTGTNLICESKGKILPSNQKHLGFIRGIEFKNPKVAFLFGVRSWRTFVDTQGYKVTPEEIKFSLFSINRETLEINGFKLSCRIVDFDVVEYIEDALKHAIQEQNKKNKL